MGRIHAADSALVRSPRMAATSDCRSGGADDRFLSSAGAEQATKTFCLPHQLLMPFGILLALASACFAHVGSPDVFYEGSAGPYRLMVTIRPPQVVPGVAEVEIRSASPDLRRLKIAASPLTGPAAQFPPTPDVLRVSKEDPQFYTGSVWLMACCSWQVRIWADGSQGEGLMSVPVAGIATRRLGMQRAVGATLLFFMVVLAVGAVSISGAYAREGQLEPGKQPDDGLKRRGRRTMIFTAVFVVTLIYLGKLWWDSDDNTFQRFINSASAPCAMEQVSERTRSEEPCRRVAGKRPLAVLTAAVGGAGAADACHRRW